MKGISFATEYKQANNIHRAHHKDLASDNQKAHAFRTGQYYLSFFRRTHMKRIDMPLSYLVSGQRTAFRFAVASSPHMSLETDPAIATWLLLALPASEIIDAYIPQSLESLRHHLFARESCDAPSAQCARENPRFLRRAQ